MNFFKNFFKKITEPMPLSDFDSYDEYWDARGHVAPAALTRARVVEKHILANSSILDIGCGAGEVIKYLSNVKSPRRIFGIDISEASVDRLKRSGFEAAVIDILSDDFSKFLESNDFSHILLFEVIEHLPNPEDLIRRIERSGFFGDIFISIPNSGYFIHRIRLMFGRFPVVSVNVHVKEHLRFWTIKDFLFWGGYLGMEILNYESATSLKKSLIRKLAERFSLSLFCPQVMYRLRFKRHSLPAAL